MGDARLIGTVIGYQKLMLEGRHTQETHQMAIRAILDCEERLNGRCPYDLLLYAFSTGQQFVKVSEN